MRTATAHMTTARGSLEDFYAASYARLVAVLTVTAGSRVEAEEVVQEAFVRLVPRWDKVSQYDDPEQWVRTVAWRLATSRWRRVVTGSRALRRHGPPPDVPAPSTTPLEVEQVLAGLSREHRQVLVLHYGLGLSVEECAAQLGIAAGTVKSRLSRARTAARQESPDA